MVVVETIREKKQNKKQKNANNNLQLASQNNVLYVRNVTNTVKLLIYAVLHLLLYLFRVYVNCTLPVNSQRLHLLG